MTWKNTKRLTVNAMTGCETTNKIFKSGYSLHRQRWIAERGKLPAGVELDHFCKNTECVALEHLEGVSRSENELRKQHWKPEYCPEGHSGPFIISPWKGWICETCKRAILERFINE